MKKLATLMIVAGLAAPGCGKSNSPTAPTPTPTPGPTTTNTVFTVALSAANEVPPITNAEAGATGTATITFHVTKDASGATTALPIGKRALYSGARPEPDSVATTSGNPLAERGSVTVECARCHQTSYVGLLDLLIYQFPLGYWLPRGRFDHRMTCPACRRRAWCSLTLRRS